MPKAYSDDLRMRVAAAVLAGRSCRETAALFSVSVSSAVKWSQRMRATGNAAARPPGCKRPRSLAAHRDWVLRRLEAEPKLPLRALLAELEAQGIATSYGSLWRLIQDADGRPGQGGGRRDRRISRSADPERDRAESRRPQSGKCTQAVQQG